MTPIRFLENREFFPQIEYQLQALGFDVRKVTKNGENTLHQAVRKQNIPATNLAIDYGFDLSQRNNSGNTPLHIAAEKGNLELCQLLIEKGADIYAQNNRDQTPFHIALYYKHKEITDYFEKTGYPKNSNLKDFLIAEGLRPDYIDPAGNTLTHRLAMKKNFVLMQDLIQANMACLLPNKHNDSPLSIAIKQKDLSMLKILIPSMQSSLIRDYDLALAAQLGWTEGLKLLLDTQSPEILNKMFPTRCSLIHYAAFSGEISTIQLLINRGASINTKTLSEYRDRVLESDYWTNDDWSAWAEFSWNDSVIRVIKEGGWLYPVVTPLGIIEQLHPEKNDLIQYCQELGAKSEYYPSLKKEPLKKYLNKLPS